MPWEESNYAQLWVNWHYARMLLDARDYEKAYLMLTNVMDNVVDSKPEGDKMMALAREKTHRG